MKKRLSELVEGEEGWVREVREKEFSHEGIVRRILELGLVEGLRVRLLKRAPFGGDPVAVEVRGTTIGMRLSEAEHIIVEVEANVEGNHHEP